MMIASFASMHLAKFDSRSHTAPHRPSNISWWQQRVRFLARAGIVFIAILAVIPRLEGSDISSGLQAQWSFSEGSGSTASDGTGHGNTATFQSGTTWSTGPTSSGVFFDGVGGLTVPTSASVSISGNITLSAWLKVYDTSLNAAMRLISKKSAYTDVSGYELTYNPSTGIVAFSGSGSSQAYGVMHLDGAWHHIACSVSGTTAQIYVDGAAITMTVSTVSVVQSGSTSLSLGRLTGSTGYLTGTLDEVRIYSRSLTAVDVAALTATETPQARMIWPFNEGSGTTATDTTANGHTGTIHNGMWVVDPIRGKVLSFNGTTSYVQAPDASSLQITGGLTLAAWIKPNSVSYPMKIISKKNAYTDAGGYQLQYNPSASNLAIIGGNGAKIAYGTASLGTAWHHVAGTINGSTAQLYVDGLPITMGSVAVDALAASTQPLNAGIAGDSSGIYSGLMSDLRVYSGAMLADAIRTLVYSTTTPTVAFQLGSSSADEGAGTAQLSVVLDRPAPAQVTVAFTVTGGTATGGGTDYLLPNGNLTFAVGQQTAVIPLIIRDDTMVEGNETVQVSLSSPVNAVLGTTAIHTFTIIDNDAIAVQVAPGSPTATEGGANGSFVFSRTGSLASSLAVTFSVGGTAVSGGDYSSLGTSVVIPAGSATMVVPVTAIDDALQQPTRTVILSIQSGSGYTVGASHVATVTLIDNDVVTISATKPVAAEGATPTTGQFTVSRSGSTAASLTVGIALSGSAAQTRYSRSWSGSTITIPAGSASTLLTITPINDAVAGGQQTVIATIVPGTTCTAGLANSATITINDDDVPTVTVAATDATASEPGQDTGTVTFTRTNSIGSLTVTYGITGTATNGVDYALLRGGFKTHDQARASKSVCSR